MRKSVTLDYARVGPVPSIGVLHAKEMHSQLVMAMHELYFIPEWLNQCEYDSIEPACPAEHYPLSFDSFENECTSKLEKGGNHSIY